MEEVYMSFKNINKQTVNIVLQENKRLKCENQRLRESIDELQRYKDEYKNLIEQLNSIKEKYIGKVAEFYEIEKKCRAKLNDIKISKKRKDK